MAKPTVLIAAAVDRLRKSDIMRVPALIAEFGRVLKQKDWSVARGISHPCRIKIAAQDFTFLDLRIGKEPVSGFGISPILTGQRNCHIGRESWWERVCQFL